MLRSFGLIIKISILVSKSLIMGFALIYLGGENIRLE